MSKAGLVLVHGANHHGIHWQPTTEALGVLDPTTEVVVVDLPARAGVAADLATLSIATCVDRVVEQIDGSSRATHERPRRGRSATG